MKAVYLFALSFTLAFTAVQAQQSPATAKAGQSRGPYTLEQQFNSLKFRSSPYKEFNHDYRVVRVDYLDRLMKNVQDSLQNRSQSIRQAGKATELALAKAQKDLKLQQSELQSLKMANEQKDQQIKRTVHDVASLSVFGFDMDKQLYVILSWVVIFGLGALALVFAFMYKKSKVVTDEKVNAFEEISQEFKDFKQNAREREIKIKRELQTEANRVEELNQQLTLLKKQVSL